MHRTMQRQWRQQTTSHPRSAQLLLATPAQTIKPPPLISSCLLCVRERGGWEGDRIKNSSFSFCVSGRREWISNICLLSRPPFSLREGCHGFAQWHRRTRRIDINLSPLLLIPPHAIPPSASFLAQVNLAPPSSYSRKRSFPNP